MGVKIKWDDQSSQNLDGIEIYRSATRISSSNPGTPLTTLPGTATAYEDFAVVNKSLYYYRICSKKGTDRAWSENILAGYFSETGPGNSMPLRGDWNAGMMDIVSPANFISNAALRAKVPALAALPSAGEPTNWYKFSSKGKVLFIPNAHIVTASWQQLYNAGLVYGTNDNGVRPATAPAGTVNQYTTVDINGLRYVIRCPRLSVSPLDQFALTQADTVGSEWRDTMARCLADGIENIGGRQTRLFDDSAVVTVFGQHWATTALVTRTGSTNAPETYNSLAPATAQAVALVLELVMP